MPKKIVVAVMLAVSFLGALVAVISLMKKNESVAYNKSYTWYADFDASDNSETLVKGRKINEIKSDVNKLIIALNKASEETETRRSQGEEARTSFPQIALRKIEQRTAELEVVNDQYLTQKMGSSGAQGYLAGATYTLTENPGIRSVNFIFQPGEHAMPGIYSRESFTGYKLMTEDAARR